MIPVLFFILFTLDHNVVVWSTNTDKQNHNQAQVSQREPKHCYTPSLHTIFGLSVCSDGISLNMDGCLTKYLGIVLSVINKTWYSSPRQSTWYNVLNLLFLAALPNLRKLILVLILTTEDKWLLHCLLHNDFCWGGKWSQDTHLVLQHSGSKWQKKKSPENHN